MTTYPEAPPITDTARPDKRKVGMAAFLVSEAVFFTTLVTTYVYFLNTRQSGPTPKEILEIPIILPGTILLYASSALVHRAMVHRRAGRRRRFLAWWAGTFVCGAAFVANTIYEWHDLFLKNFTPSTNLFGSTFYTLVGFHALHVTTGLVMLATIFFTSLTPSSFARRSVAPELVSWYWHFVDAVWVVVFGVVYLTTL